MSLKEILPNASGAEYVLNGVGASDSRTDPWVEVLAVEAKEVVPIDVVLEVKDWKGGLDWLMTLDGEAGLAGWSAGMSRDYDGVMQASPCRLVHLEASDSREYAYLWRR